MTTMKTMTTMTASDESQPFVPCVCGEGHHVIWVNMETPIVKLFGPKPTNSDHNDACAPGLPHVQKSNSERKQKSFAHLSAAPVFSIYAVALAATAAALEIAGAK